jgi:hypothetical protein
MKFGHFTIQVGPIHTKLVIDMTDPTLHSYLSKSRVWLHFINSKSKRLRTVRHKLYCHMQSTEIHSYNLRSLNSCIYNI